jgi:hypothetical protein
MGVTVTFDYAAWVARYPEFSTVTQPMAQDYFNEATLYFRNDGGGPCNDASVQLTLLNMLTAHIAQLNAIINGVVPSPLVGPLSDVSEGSVSAATDLSNIPGSAAWYNQTKYGFAFWAATRGWRTAVYRPFRRFIPSGGAFGGGRGL